jgi:methyl-accepting chemotaxis protein
MVGSNMSQERKQVWIDSFQTRLSLRMSGYVIVFFLVFCNLLFVWKMIAEGPHDPAQQFLDAMSANVPVFVCLLALVPVMAWDLIRFSHRLVGPLVRFRKTIQDIANGEAVRPIKLRDGDYLQELRDDFNQMLESLQKRGVEIIKPTAPAEDCDGAKKSA